ncbi:hypothetical protein GGS24DRAFT_500765 [Hypoxylon argillaceum]|nr:hypothetical protein GGS24DRAFT_500765 [Hypoxylon argillaceum]
MASSSSIPPVYSLPIRAKLFDGYTRDIDEDIDEDSMIWLGLSTGDGYGYRSLRLYKQRLSFFEDSALGGLPELIPATEKIESRHNNIIYFDFDTMENLELYQTIPLERVATITSVAVDWRSFDNQEKLKESLMTIYSQLYNVYRIIIVVDRHHWRPSSDNVRDFKCPFSIYSMPLATILGYEKKPVSWCTLGKRIQEMIGDRAFWQECNRAYALHQIFPVGLNLPRVPQICLVRFDRGLEREPGLHLCMPAQMPTLVGDLAPELAEVDELWNPEQPENPMFADFNLRDLLH